MAWSIFSDGGGDGAALTWAQQLLNALGAPDTPGNQQFIYDWEKSEGGGGKYNPLNQGPVPGHPELTTTGSQYGGGAADYASYAAGIQGSVDYLNMSNYTAVKSALLNNDPTAARTALIQSPWAASHYGYGSSFSSAPIPGQASSLLGDSGSVQNASVGTGGTVQPANWFTNLFSYNGQLNDLKDLFNGATGNPSSGLGAGIQSLVERGALIVFGGIIIIVGLLKLTGSDKTIVQAATMPVTKAKGVVKAVDK